MTGAWDWAAPARVTDLATAETADAAGFAALIGNAATALRGAGAGAGDIAMLSISRPIPLLAHVFAAWRIGATAAVLDAGYSARELDAFEAFLRPKAVIADDGARAGDDAAAPAVGGIDAPALLLATSGTTGAPKFVSLSHRALLARVSGNVAAIGTRALSRTLATLPLSFGHGLIGVCLSACAARGEIFFAEKGVAGAMRLGAAIDLHRIGFMSSVPSYWRMALRAPPPSGGALRRVHVGSAPLSAEMAASINAWTGDADVWNCYGITETANWVAGEKIGDGFRDNQVGRPFDAAVFAVETDDGAVASSGSGEILIRSASQLTAYHLRGDATAAAHRDGWFRTGDAGRLDDTGLTLLGRLKDEVNVAGFKVNPAEIDFVLESHPDVAEACAYGRDDAISGQAVAAAVRLKPGAELDAATLRRYAAANLRSAATPVAIAFVDEIPLTGRGKISRDAVRAAIEGK